MSIRQLVLAANGIIILSLPGLTYATVIEVIDDSFSLGASWEDKTKRIEGQYFDYTTGEESNYPRSVSLGPSRYDSRASSSISFSDGPDLYSYSYDPCYKTSSVGEGCGAGSTFASISFTITPVGGAVRFRDEVWTKQGTAYVTNMSTGERFEYGTMKPGTVYKATVATSNSYGRTGERAGLSFNGVDEWRVRTRAVPEPSTIVLFGLGAAGLVFRRNKAKSR